MRGEKKRRAALIAGHESPDYPFLNRVIWERFDLYAADHGADVCHKLHLAPLALIGDFDSLRDSSLLEKGRVPVLRLPAEKDISDLYYALDYIRSSASYETITLFNADSGRPDHFYFNLRAVDHFGPQVSMATTHGILSLLTPGKKEKLAVPKGTLFSLLPLERSFNVMITGARYPLDKVTLDPDTLSLSNVSGEKTEIFYSKGRILLFMAGFPEDFPIER